MSQPLRHRLAALALSSVVFAAALVIATWSTVATAGAAPPTGRILIQPCLNLRADAIGSSELLECVPYNLTIAIDCTKLGGAVTGPYGTTTIWDHTTYNGKAGFVSDAWVYTGQSGAVAGTCAAPTPATTPPPAPAGPAAAVGAPSLGLPWASGTGTLSSGCHSWADSQPICSSLDFVPPAGQSVVAPVDGIVRRDGACAAAEVRIETPSGWSVSFYHLQGNLPAAGTTISRNMPIGEIGRGTPCGGTAESAHAHMTLWKPGGSPLTGASFEASMVGVSIGGWTLSTNPSIARQACLTEQLSGATACTDLYTRGAPVFATGQVGSVCSVVACSVRSLANQRFVSGEFNYSGNENAVLRARNGGIGSWEQFRIEGDCRSSLGCAVKAANGLYVSAELNYKANAYGMLRARSSGIGSWERFRLVGDCRSAQGCALQSLANSLYVSAEINETGGWNGILRARSGGIGGWERFQIG